LKSKGLIRAAIPSFLFALFFAGRWVRLSPAAPPGIRAAAGLTFGTAAALLGYFVVELVLAEGYLKGKIRSIKIAAAYIIIAAAASFIFGTRWLPYAVAISAIVLAAALIAADIIKKRERYYDVDTSGRLPQKYLKRHPVKTFLETVFRLFPYPSPVGLYDIGSPGPDSDIFVTGSYDLTVRRAAKALKGENCRLLVCNSRGINIWCSSLAGHFGTDDIISAINLTGLAEKVSRRKLILPQLCAANVDIHKIKHKTGFSCSFGPVYISDIKEYLKYPDGMNFRQASFEFKQRAEMALGCPIILLFVLICIYNFLGLENLLFIVPVIYLISFLSALIYPHRPVRNIFAWSVITGAAVFTALYMPLCLLIGVVSFGNALAVSVGGAYLVTELSGWSPLIKYGLMPYKQPHISIDQRACTGCGMCEKVCPKAVFEVEGGASTVIRPGECIQCKACIKQCPATAITHSFNKVS
jgi:NAD-dependent dihydropyrimidine dehydrogenase PreA subunit